MAAAVRSEQNLNPQWRIPQLPLIRNICWNMRVLLGSCLHHHIGETIPSPGPSSSRVLCVEGICLFGFGVACLAEMRFCFVI